MNRKLKFRIWDNRYKCFLENGSSLHCESNWQINPFTGEVSDFISAISWEEASYSKEEFPEGRFTIQQFTGLKDSKRREIFEGDIIEYENNGRKFQDQVFWETDSFMVGSTKKRAVYYVGAVNKVSKVVGNIFESPNLLK